MRDGAQTSDWGIARIKEPLKSGFVVSSNRSSSAMSMSRLRMASVARALICGKRRSRGEGDYEYA